MVTMYKGEAQCTADRDQVATMQNAGWSLKAPGNKKKKQAIEEAPTVAEEVAVEETPTVVEEVLATPEEAPASAKAKKKRRSISK